MKKPKVEFMQQQYPINPATGVKYVMNAKLIK